MGCNQSSPGAPKGSDMAKGKGSNGETKAVARVAARTASARLESKQENTNYLSTMQFLCKVPLCQRLPKADHPKLAAIVSVEAFNSGAEVIRQGDPGSEFYIIKSGEATVSVFGDENQSKVVATLREGDYFGEAALLHDEPRAATIVAATDLVTLKITRADFKDFGLAEKLVFPNRKAVAAGRARRIPKHPPSQKSKDEALLIRSALQSNEPLQTMVSLTQERITDLIAVAWKESVAPGTKLITEGDLQADYFYIVSTGKFSIYVLAAGEEELPPTSAEDTIARSASKVSSKLMKQVGPGGSFGELALLYVVPRAATVVATEESTVFVIDRDNFKEIFMKVSKQKIEGYVKYLQEVEILGPLSAEERLALAKALVEMHFDNSETILQQGEAGNTFYILYEGEVDVMIDGVKKSSLKAGQGFGVKYFGERALLKNEPRAATVVVTSSTAKALALDRESFDLLLGPLQALLKRDEAALQAGGNATPLPGGHRWRGDAIKKKDLRKVGLLGCGGFGVVDLVEHKQTGETFAMKAISKGYIVSSGMQEGVLNEKNILMMTESTFVIRLYDTYNGKQTLSFLLEAALGGELYATVTRKGLHGSARHTKFYAAGTVCAFEHLHERRIIYRDLKPENILLNSQGQYKLTDMGLAKFVIGKTHTTCGTPDYFAPEVIASSGHTNAVDWWCLGIFIYEMMSGHPPFESAYPLQIYAKVMKGIQKVQFPPKCQGTVGMLIKDLLKREPSERLPMRPGGASNVKDHQWYQGFAWTDFEAMKMEAPYQPVVKTKRDIANFAPRKEDMPRQMEYRDDGTGWDKDFASSS